MAKNKTTGHTYFTGMESFREEPVEQEVENVEQQTAENSLPIEQKNDTTPVTAPVMTSMTASTPVVTERNEAVEQTTVSTAANQKAQKKRERRSKRMNLLVTPSIFDGMTEIAEREDRSVNDILNALMQDYIEENL